MKKLKLILLLGSVFVLSGCSAPSLPKKNPMKDASFIRSSDAGITWEPKVKLANEEKKVISSASILTIVVDPTDGNNVYLGTEGHGILNSKDGGENWDVIKFPDKVYGIALDPRNTNVIYASGILGTRGKIFKRLNPTEEWKEIYTEPNDGTFISSMAIDKFNPNVLYAGTNAGVIIKTTDAGATWKNIERTDRNYNQAPITHIAFDARNSSIVYFAEFQEGILRLKDGKTIEDISKSFDKAERTGNIFSLYADPYHANTLYVGSDNGIMKSKNNGDAWERLNVIESAKGFPVRAIAINPANSNELFFSAGKTIYKSVDGGQKWSTYQMDNKKNISIMKYNSTQPSQIYAGLRNID